MFGLSELAVVLIVVVLLIGAKRLPDLARSAGKSARILKAEAKAMKEQQAADRPQSEHPADPPGTGRVVEGTVVPPGTGPVNGVTWQPAREPGPEQPRNT